MNFLSCMLSDQTASLTTASKCNTVGCIVQLKTGKYQAVLCVPQVQTYAWTVLDGSASVAAEQVRESQTHV